MSSDPSTPISRQYSFKPLNSSPLSFSPLNRSQAFERRRLQFKSQNPISSLSRSSTLPSLTSRRFPCSRTRSIPSNTTPNLSGQNARPHFTHPEDNQKQFLRERIKAKCIERAQKARERAVKQRRYTGYSDRSSDGFEMEDEDEDEEENDDDIMSDEVHVLFILTTVTHCCPLKYSFSVG